MKRQLQGIALLLFGLMVFLLALTLRLPFLEDLGVVLLYLLAWTSAIAGLILALRGEK